MIEPDHFDEKLAGGGSSPTIYSVAPSDALFMRLGFNPDSVHPMRGSHRSNVASK